MFATFSIFYLDTSVRCIECLQPSAYGYFVATQGGLLKWNEEMSDDVAEFQSGKLKKKLTAAVFIGVLETGFPFSRE